MKNFFKKVISGNETPADKTAMLREKWQKHELVAQWQKNGWLDEEPADVMAYLLSEWERRNEPVPPVHKVKVSTISEFAKEYKYDTLIETGTYLGTMIDAQKGNFKKIISIEVDPGFHNNAKEKFKAFPHIHFLLGDSGKLMAGLMPEIETPAIFWLDAHYNNRSSVKLDKECPIYEELDAIFDSRPLDHILLIDDARLFIGKNDYPTIPELTDYIHKKRPDYRVEIKNDIIRAMK